jgi:hypothetical protein
MTERSDARQQGYSERTDARQQNYTERQENRQQYAGEHYGGGYYGGGNDDWDDDDWDDGEVAAVAVGAAALGAVGGYVAGTETAENTTVVYNTPSPAGYTSLPCTPNVVPASGTTYYQCGSTWYTQAYGGSGVSYMVVAPPPGY